MSTLTHVVWMQKSIAIVFLNFQLFHGGSRDISESEVFQKAVQMVRLVNDRYNIITVQIFELISLSFAATRQKIGLGMNLSHS